MNPTNASLSNRLGAVYRCPVCGAEVLVIRADSGRLAPVCCNRPMVRLAARARIFYCPVCGAELAVIRDAGGELAPVCCNRPMLAKIKAA